MQQNIEKIQEITLHGLDYIISLNADQNQLYINVELKSTGEMWKNVFMSNYIEEITAKTGNQKKFPVFIKMLLSAIQQQSDSVFIDILSFQDLEMLKSRKNIQKKNNPNVSQNLSTQQSQNSMQSLQINNKRYVILTYSAEFDKVHYPLPLNLDENPDVEQLKNTITRLRIENEELKKSGFESSGGSNQTVIQLKQENEINKQRIRKLEEINQKLHSNLDGNTNTDSNQVQELQQVIFQKEKQITEIKNQNLQLKNELVNNNQQSQLVEQLSVAKDKFKEMDNIIQQLMDQLNEQKQINEKQQYKIQSLETELEGTLQNKSKLLRSGSKNNLQNSQMRNSRISSIHSNTSNSKRCTSQPIKVKQSPMKFKNSRQASPARNSAKKDVLNTSNSSINKRKININNSSIYSNRSNLNRQTPTKNRVSVMDQQTASSRNKQINQSFANRSPSPMRKNSASKIRDQSPRNQQILKPKTQGQYQYQASPRGKNNNIPRISRSNSKNNLNQNENSNIKKSVEKKKVISSYQRASQNNNSQNSINLEEPDEEGRLLKKLQMLRQKNKENNSLIGNQNKQEQSQQYNYNNKSFNDEQQNSQNYGKSFNNEYTNDQSFQQDNHNNLNTENDNNRSNGNQFKKQKNLDVSDIDQRLNNLSDLLKMAKQ